MKTSRYDFTKMETWAAGKPHLERMVDVIRTLINNGMDPDDLANDLENIYRLTPEPINSGN